MNDELKLMEFIYLKHKTHVLNKEKNKFIQNFKKNMNKLLELERRVCRSSNNLLLNSTEELNQNYHLYISNAKSLIESQENESISKEENLNAGLISANDIIFFKYYLCLKASLLSRRFSEKEDEKYFIEKMKENKHKADLILDECKSKIRKEEFLQNELLQFFLKDQNERKTPFVIVKYKILK